MTIEHKLRSLILTRYKSIREFTIVADIPYTTFDSILKRGVNNSNVGNVIKICNSLNLDIEALAAGSIVPRDGARIDASFLTNNPETVDISDIVNDTKSRLFNVQHLTINGKEIDIEYAESIVDALDLGYKMVERKTARQAEEVKSQQKP